MTTRPTDDPTVIATSATHPAGSSPWSGQDTKVDPVPLIGASGWTPGDRPAAEHFNHIANNHGSWLEVIAERLGISPHATTVFREVALFTPSVRPDSTWLVDVGTDDVGRADDGFDEDFLWWDLAPYVGIGATITSVEATVTPNGARGTGDRMILALVEHSGGAITVTDKEDDGSAGLQTISLSPGVVVSTGTSYMIRVRPSIANDAGSNKISRIRVEVQD